MISRINNTNTITLARALLALSTVITLIFTDIDDLFPIHHIEKIKSSPTGLMKMNFFLWFDNIYIPYIFSIIALLIIIIGIYPKFLCFIHSWIAYSVFYSMLIVEGGDQINCILTLLLIPICFLDNRKNGWYKTNFLNKTEKSFLSLNAKYALLFIKIQMAVLYLNAGISKIFASEWSNGTAVYYWFYDNMFGAPIWIQNSLGFLFKNDISVSFINWGVIVLELLLFSALFLRQSYKYLFLIFGILFHFTIILIHGLPTFFLAMSAGLLLYLSRLDISIKQNILKIKNNYIKIKQYVIKRI